MNQNEIKIKILECLNKNEGIPKMCKGEITELDYRKLLGEMEQEQLLEQKSISGKSFYEWKYRIKSLGITYLEKFRR